MITEEILFIVGIILGLTIILSLAILGIFFYFKNFKKTNLQKKIGQVAEVQIGAKFKKWAEVHKAIWIPNALYKYNDNKYFEVDGILITSRALIVVEMKSIKGSILGIANQNKLLKKNGKAEFTFPNPILQNEKHLDHVIAMTKVKVPVLSMVVFSDRANSLKVTHIPEHVFLIKEDQIIDALWEMYKQLKPKLHKSNMEFLKEKIEKHITTNVEDYEQFAKITNSKR